MASHIANKLVVNVSNIETNIGLPTQAQVRSINFASEKNVHWSLRLKSEHTYTCCQPIFEPTITSFNGCKMYHLYLQLSPTVPKEDKRNSIAKEAKAILDLNSFCIGRGICFRKYTITMNHNEYIQLNSQIKEDKCLHTAKLFFHYVC